MRAVASGLHVQGPHGHVHAGAKCSLPRVEGGSPCYSCSTCTASACLGRRALQEAGPMAEAGTAPPVGATAGPICSVSQALNVVGECCGHLPGMRLWRLRRLGPVAAAAAGSNRGFVE